MQRLMLIVLLSMSIPAFALAEDAGDANQQNAVCGPDVSAGKFKLSEIGPKIAGTWQATAPGIGYAQGVQSIMEPRPINTGEISPC